MNHFTSHSPRINRLHPHAGSSSSSFGMGLQQGFTLIEVLISLVLFSVGVLGFVALQAAAASFTQSSENVTRASLLANEIAAQMQNAGTSNLPGAAKTNWQSMVSGATVSNLSLPQGAGDYTIDASGTATILITWSEPQNVLADGSQKQSRYQTIYRPD
jgi:type IV pilus assembly protein PilV